MDRWTRPLSEAVSNYSVGRVHLRPHGREARHRPAKSGTPVRIRLGALPGEGKIMPRGVRKSIPVPEPLPYTEPYPEHAKMHPHLRANDAIREFWEFLSFRGLTELSWTQWDDALLEFRGVDRLAYLAESARMRSEYRWLWEKHMPEVVEPAEARPVITEKVEKVGSEGNGALADLLAKIRGGRRDADQD